MRLLRLDDFARTLGDSRAAASDTAPRLLAVARLFACDNVCFGPATSRGRSVARVRKRLPRLCDFAMTLSCRARKRLPRLCDFARTLGCSRAAASASALRLRADARLPAYGRVCFGSATSRGRSAARVRLRLLPLCNFARTLACSIQPHLLQFYEFARTPCCSRAAASVSILRTSAAELSLACGTVCFSFPSSRRNSVARVGSVCFQSATPCDL